MEEDRAIADLGTRVQQELEEEEEASKKIPKRRFIGRRAAEAKAAAKEAESHTSSNGSTTIEDSGAVQLAPRRRTARALNNVPDSILKDVALNEAIALLPANYNFELHKTIHRIRSREAQKVALQMPEGLLLFATTISDIITRFCPGTTTLIMGDVTYGACCIDDYTARALGCDILIHYAHSCLIPVSITQIHTLYVFVDISIDVEHLLATITRNFPSGHAIALVGTIQFNATIHGIAPQLRSQGYSIVIPQIAPLSKGEILGCTSPVLTQRNDSHNNPTITPISTTDPVDCILYLGDGRFHLESAMIHNPSLPAYRYDPYSRRLTHEAYAHSTLHSDRSAALTTARKARKWGLILGSLGRQGNPHTLTLIEQKLVAKGLPPPVSLLLSEIFPAKLALMSEDVECWVQVACPRLSIDWGHAFRRPLLTAYEALLVLGGGKGAWEEDEGQVNESKGRYPMDYYGKEGLGRVKAEDVGVVG